MQNSSRIDGEETPNTDNHEGSKLMCLESGIRPNNECGMFRDDSTSRDENDVSRTGTAIDTCPQLQAPLSSEEMHSKMEPETKRIKLNQSTEAAVCQPSQSDPSNQPFSKSSTRKLSSTSSTGSITEEETPSMKSEDTHGTSSSVDADAPAGSGPLPSASDAENKSDSSLPVAEKSPGAGVVSPIMGPQTLSGSPAGPQHPPASTPMPCPPVPLKSLRMSHLHVKYHAELEYMLKEFRKLESQLLGAKGNGTGVQESAGSRERREKLHSFILHLEDTIRQIEVGVRLEGEGKPTVNSELSSSEESARKQVDDASALSNMTKEKEEEENVQKLEEHILANLLPVKVRLKKQLAAQQGATKNPVGMPTARRGMLQAPAAAEKGTFAIAAEQRFRAAEAAQIATERQESCSPIAPAAPSQFGKPLCGGGSSLTQKLHGSTLGSNKRSRGHGAGSQVLDHVETQMETTEEAQIMRKVLYGGMAPGSDQIMSGVSAAAGVHEMVMETPSLVKSLDTQVVEAPKPVLSSDAAQMPPYVRTIATKSVPLPHPGANSKAGLDQHPKTRIEDPALSEEERKRLRKLRRSKKKRRDASRREKERQKQILLQQQAAQAQIPKVVSKKGGKNGTLKLQGKKKGPRSVEYICSLCSETYGSTCDHNPWWALTSHECPKCRKTQVPRIDIASPANAIEYHPALLAHADDAAGSGMEGSPQANNSGIGVVRVNPGQVPSPSVYSANHGNRKFPKYPHISMSDTEDSDFSDLSDGLLSDFSGDSDDSDDLPTLSPGEQAENENFGHGYSGPVLGDMDAKRMLVLMGHASTCPGRHKNAKHRDVCSSTKYLMLHVRDCPGTTATFDICPFPWCRKVKHLLYHLVSCQNPKECFTCNEKGLSESLTALVGLNEYRRKKHNERVKAAMVAAVAAAKSKPKPAVKSGLVKKPVPTGIVKPPPYKPLPGARPGAVRPPPPPLRPGLKPGPLAIAAIKPSIPSSALRPAKSSGVKAGGNVPANHISKPSPGPQSLPRPSSVISSSTKVVAQADVSRMHVFIPSSASTQPVRVSDSHGGALVAGPEVNQSNPPVVPAPVSTAASNQGVPPGRIGDTTSKHSLGSVSQGNGKASENNTTATRSSPDVLEVTACLKANFESAAACHSVETPVNISSFPAATTIAETKLSLADTLTETQKVIDSAHYVVPDQVSAGLEVTMPVELENAVVVSVEDEVTLADARGSYLAVESSLDVMDVTSTNDKSTEKPAEVQLVFPSSLLNITHDAAKSSPPAPMAPHLPPIVSDEEPATESAIPVKVFEVEVAETPEIISEQVSDAAGSQTPRKGSTESPGLEESEKKALAFQIGC